MLDDQEGFNPHVTTIITETTARAGGEPLLPVTDEWIPINPFIAQRSVIQVGGVDQASDTLLVNPVQFRTTGEGTGTLRRYRQVVLEITYIDPNVVDAATLADTLAPVIVGPTLRQESTSSLRISASASDMDGATAPSLHAAYTLDGTTWNEVDLVLNQEVYSVVVPLRSGANSVSAIITARDGAGNSSSENVAGSFAGDFFTYMPFLRR
jgi:hypothetical protein